MDGVDSKGEGLGLNGEGGALLGIEGITNSFFVEVAAEGIEGGTNGIAGTEGGAVWGTAGTGGGSVKGLGISKDGFAGALCKGVGFVWNMKN